MKGKDAYRKDAYIGFLNQFNEFFFNDIPFVEKYCASFTYVSPFTIAACWCDSVSSTSIIPKPSQCPTGLIMVKYINMPAIL